MHKTLFTIETQTRKPTFNGCSVFHFCNLWITMHLCAPWHSPSWASHRKQSTFDSLSEITYGRAGTVMGNPTTMAFHFSFHLSSFPPIFSLTFPCARLDTLWPTSTLKLGIHLLINFELGHIFFQSN